MNKAILHGNTGKDPEIKITDSGKKVARFSLATKSFRKDKDDKNVSDWHNLIFWDKLAELCEKYVKKGSELIVEGEIQYRDYTNKEGVKKYITEIVCHSLEFCSGKKEPAPEKIADKQGEWQGKKEVKPMSDINQLPGANDTPANDELSDLPF
ncbi:MAG: single-stranded DNA-binding protein [Saccharofermentanaceae bacterium]|jgi:single-strand DNA-binding protein